MLLTNNNNYYCIIQLLHKGSCIMHHNLSILLCSSTRELVFRYCCIVKTTVCNVLIIIALKLILYGCIRI